MSANSSLTIRVLEKHSSRDKVIRSCSYLATFLSTRLKSREPQLLTFAKSLSESRVVMRLFDDVPALVNLLNTIQGQQDIVAILIRILDFLYLPVEHLHWLNNYGMVKTSDRWRSLAVMIWALSLSLNILRQSYRVYEIRQKRFAIAGKLSKVSDNQEWLRLKDQLKQLTKQELHEMTILLKCLCDWFNAVDWLPFRLLWKRQIPKSVSALLGLSSSLLALKLSLA